MDLDLLRELKCKNGNGIIELAEDEPDLFRGRSPQGNTTLHIASRTGNISVVHKIITILPCLVYERNQRGETPLHIAAAAGDVNIVKLLVRKEENDNEIGQENTQMMQDNEIGQENTPMMQDNEIGQENTLRMQDNENNTPLHIAVRNRHLKVVQELMKVDTEPVFSVNKAGQSPLSIAIDASSIDASSTKIARWIIRKTPDSLNYEGSNKMTLLHSAVMRLNYDVTKDILEAKKDLLTKEDVKQRNALHYAAAAYEVKNIVALLSAADDVKNIVALLSEEDDKSLADKSLANKPDCNGQTPIHLATIIGRLGVVEMLVNNYPDVIEVLDNNQRNILHLAAQHGHGHVVSFILKLPEKDDLLNTLDKDGNTPLHLAAMNFRDNVVDTLCREMKWNVRATNRNQQTALEIAKTSNVEATENKKYLTLKALKETYKNRALDPEDIIANGCLSGSGTGENRQMIRGKSTDDQGKIERAKKLAEVILMLTSIVAAFTFTAALTVPEKFNYHDVSEQNGKLSPICIWQITTDVKADGFIYFMYFAAVSSASCLSASIIICWLFWQASNHHEYFIKRLSVAVFLTIMGLVSMALAFMCGVFVVLSNNPTIPMGIVWSVSILPLFLYVLLPIYFRFATTFIERKLGVDYFLD